MRYTNSSLVQNIGQSSTFAQQHASTASDVLVEREKVRFEIMQVLTPDQRQKFDQMRVMRTNQLADRLSSLGDQL